MRRVVLQPAGSEEANAHYLDTVMTPVGIDRVSDFVELSIVNNLKEAHKDGEVPVWGVTPGKNGVNIKKWERVQTGDIVLFSRKNKIFASASVAFTTHNKNLALELWGVDPQGETWEYVYFLDEVKQQDISYADFNKTAGYKENNVIQGFSVLDEEKSEVVIKYFELESEVYSPLVSQEEFYNATVLDPMKILDKESVVKGRTEQSFLRNYLFQGRHFKECGICGKEYPVAFLVASHIKKRANCTDEERRDFKNIVIPMCKFGCDELYEKGFITVNEGKIIAVKQKNQTDAIIDYTKNLIGKNCLYYTADNFKYFKWHFDKFFT